MPGTATTIGPFVGGLNTRSDPTAVADSELVQCENFELDLDGSLVSRPPIADNGVSMPLGATGNVEILGYFYAPGSVPYLIASDGLSSTYYYSGSSWVLLTNTLAASAMTQFNGQAWLLAPVGSASTGGYWTPSGGFVAEPNLPKGDIIVAQKSRLWVAAGSKATSNGTRLYFSDVLGSDPFWAVAPDFIDVGSGDGQNIVQVVVYYNNLLIFRTGSVYTYQYSSDPASGVVSLIIPGIGLTDKDAIVMHESYVYFMYEDRAYEFYNNRASQINIKAPFDALSRSGLYKPFAASVFGNRVIFSYYDTMFVFSLNTRTWTTWRSDVYGAIGKIVAVDQLGEFETAVTHSSRAVPPGESRSAATLFITDGPTTDKEPMHCIIKTKNYNYEASSIYKRLFWWGVDSAFRTRVTGVVTPIVYNYSVTWGQLLQSTWGMVRNFTWAQPLSGTLSVETERDTGGLGAMRKFVKFKAPIRFRQVNFRIDFETDGSVDSGPVRLFSLMTYVSAKERVAKTVS